MAVPSGARCVWRDLRLTHRGFRKAESALGHGSAAQLITRVPPSVRKMLRSWSQRTVRITTEKARGNDAAHISHSLQLIFQGGHFSVQGLPELLLLLQISENFPPDSLQALHLALALVHLPLQGLHAEGELGEDRQGLEGAGQAPGRAGRSLEGGGGRFRLAFLLKQ